MDCFSIDKSTCNISQFAIFQNFHHNLLGFGFKNMRSPQNKPAGGKIIFNGTTISRFSLFNSVFYWKSKLIYYYHKIIFLSLFRFRPSLPRRRKSGARNFFLQESVRADLDFRLRGNDVLYCLSYFNFTLPYHGQVFRIKYEKVVWKPGFWVFRRPLFCLKSGVYEIRFKSLMRS